VRILVTGADGFVGGRLVPRLVEAGHEVTATIRRGGANRGPSGVPVRELELLENASVRETVRGAFDAVAHLAAVASGGDARRDPGGAWDINASGTARIAEALASSDDATSPMLLVASTAEVYGASTGPEARSEDDAPRPCSPYAASKLGGELAAEEVARRTGLRVVIARAFPHTGAGQDQRFVAPAFARRLWEAKRAGARQVAVGNLDPVRDFLHVDDVVDAYVRILESGRSGTRYNIASGVGVTIGDVFERLRTLVGAEVEAVPDPALRRHADISHLIGDATRLRRDTGWSPRRSLDAALEEVARAEAH
jgi:GDP-4-dehydro-6-deoxy-D-mannose reductase